MVNFRDCCSSSTGVGGCAGAGRACMPRRPLRPSPPPTGGVDRSNGGARTQEVDQWRVGTHHHNKYLVVLHDRADEPHEFPPAAASSRLTIATTCRREGRFGARRRRGVSEWSRPRRPPRRWGRAAASRPILWEHMEHLATAELEPPAAAACVPSSSVVVHHRCGLRPPPPAIYRQPEPSHRTSNASPAEIRWPCRLKPIGEGKKR